MKGDKARLLIAIDMQIKSLKRRAASQPVFAEVAEREALAYSALLARVQKEFSDDEKEVGKAR